LVEIFVREVLQYVAPMENILEIGAMRAICWFPCFHLPVLIVTRKWVYKRFGVPDEAAQREMIRGVDAKSPSLEAFFSQGYE
jgi:hypothetical protein